MVITTDGSRLRERCPASRDRRRTKTGHRRYADAPWSEPKLLTLYVIGKDRTIEHEFRPIYDGTLGDCDSIFDMLVPRSPMSSSACLSSAPLKSSIRSSRSVALYAAL